MHKDLLLEMLSYKRPGNSQEVENWTKEFIDSKIDKSKIILFIDEYKNRFVTVGKNPKTAFTAHTDTVHRETGKLMLEVDEINQTVKAKDSVLGADDGTGCWILLQMISAGITGLYCFFSKEESGGVGSHYAKNTLPHLFENILQMVSFDRKGTSSIITHQGGERCCSDEYAHSLAYKLKEQGLSYELDSTGVFTDSANFVGIIPECTNLSVGYYRQHSIHEYQDLAHLEKLCSAVKKLDWEGVVMEKGI